MTALITFKIYQSISMDLSIIIVSWNCRQALAANLQALKTSQGLSFEVFVVDNNSSDGTVEMISHDFPEVTLIANSVNHGFAHACNQALAIAQGDFILLFNPDMLISEQSLSHALTWLKANPQAWVAGFKLLDTKGQIIKQVRRFPSLWDQLAIVLKIPHFASRVLKHYIVDNFNYEQASAVDSIRGSFFFIRRSTLDRVGLLDERFFVWFEEVDYCRRVYQAGGQVWYSPASMATDLVGQSFKLLPRSKAQTYFRDSQLKYFAKWLPAWQGIILRLAWLLIAPFTALASRTKQIFKN